MMFVLPHAAKNATWRRRQFARVIRENFAPGRFAVQQTAGDAPDNSVFNERRRRLAIRHVGGGRMLDTERVPTADLI